MAHNNRKILNGLFFEKNGDLNLSQLLMVVMGIAGIFGFLYQIIALPRPNLILVLAGWSFIAGAFASVLLAAIPISKAKILSESKFPTGMAEGIEGLIKNVTTSSDVQESVQQATSQFTPPTSFTPSTVTIIPPESQSLPASTQIPPEAQAMIQSQSNQAG